MTWYKQLTSFQCECVKCYEQHLHIDGKGKFPDHCPKCGHGKAEYEAAQEAATKKAVEEATKKELAAKKEVVEKKE